MRYLADLHIHSHHSRATSKTSHIRSLAAWAQIKGVHVLASGDFTHPLWMRELQECLEPAEPGFFKLKESVHRDFSVLSSFDLTTENIATRFVLSAEVSCIYKRDNRVRKIHNLLFVPDFDSAEEINRRLSAIGNLSSDGRPILKLDSRDLLEILLESSEAGFLVPAHIWTPWFSLFGSKSGFNSVEECFGDLADHIFALETGLSSDPAMNRLISMLDSYSFISNSDCHSPARICREANIFDTDFDFYSMREAIRFPCDGRGLQRFSGTVEFYPEEGKYHLDGHRKCDFCCDPLQTRTLEGICPYCGKALTVGVLSRVMELADREQAVFPDGSPLQYSLIPLVEILSELLGTGPATKTVMSHYLKLVSCFGSEMNILLTTPVEDIKKGYSSLLGEAVARIRSGDVYKKSGFDGQYGVISCFTAGEESDLRSEDEILRRRRVRLRKAD